MDTLYRHCVRRLRGAINSSFGEQDRIIGAEIGVCKGYTSQALLTIFPNLFLYMVDVWKALPASSTDGLVTRETAHEWYAEAKLKTNSMRTRRMIHHKTSVVASLCIVEGLLDFVYIDASHYFDDVLSDILFWWPKVREGGFISGHDYNGKKDQRGRWGVKKAVDLFAKSIDKRVREHRALVWSIEK